MYAHILFEAGPITVTRYGILCAAAVFAFVMLARVARGYHKRVSRRHFNAYLSFALPASFLAARFAYCLCHMDAYAPRAWSVLAVWEGGSESVVFLFSLVACACVFAFARGIDGRALLDALSPGLLALMGLLRLGEGCEGKTVTAALFENALFAYPDAYGVARYRVYGYEGVIALFLMALCLARLPRRRPDGERFARYAMVYCACMLPLDTLRDGAYARVFGYKLDALLCAAALLLILCFSALSLRRAGAPKRYVLIRALPACAILALSPYFEARAQTDVCLEANALWYFLCMAAFCACALSLRFARLRRTRAKTQT